ncbi:MAG: DUF2891 family protein, partial [Parvularculaceae bacterium]
MKYLVLGLLCLVVAGCGKGETENSDDPTYFASAFIAENTTPIISPDLTARFGQLALDCLHREYPNKISHVLADDQDVKAPHELHPAFYGCFDWHSSVHGHWLLVR